MSDQVNQAFEKWWYTSKYTQVIFHDDKNMRIALDGYQAATKASEQRIQGLEEELKDRQSDLDFEFNRAEEYEFKFNVASMSDRCEFLIKMTELQDNINQLRDALERMVESYQYEASSENESLLNAFKVLESTTAQSLAEHDNGVIERIATALENADGEFKTLPEYVSLVRGMKND